MKQEILNFSKNRSRIEEIVASIKNNNEKIVFTNGCFDILHVGHLRYLSQAKSLGDRLFIGLNSDSSVRQLKGPSRPIVPEEERAELLLGLKCVDHVILFETETPLELIKCVSPDILVKGGDWEVDQIVGSTHVNSYGGEVKSLPFVDGRSTTNIIDKILQSKGK